MKKRGRPRGQVHLTTGNDPSLWKYKSLSEAISANVDILAALVESDMNPTEETPGVDQVRTTKRPSVNSFTKEKHDDQTDVYGNVAL
jgi:hypothetical protein